MKGVSKVQAGHQLFFTFKAAQKEAHEQNERAKILKALRRWCPPPMRVYAVYPNKVARSGLRLSSIAPLPAHHVTEEDALAFAVEEALARSSS